METLIYKILRPTEWQQAQSRSHYEGSPVDLADGYIHFSTAKQAVATAQKHFADVDLVHLLEIPVAALDDNQLKWEISRGGALFPHLYAPLPMASVAHQWQVSRGKDGQFDFSAIKDIADHA